MAYSDSIASTVGPLLYWSLGSSEEQASSPKNSAYNASFTNVSYSSTPIINNDQAASKSLLIKSNSVVDITLSSGFAKDLFNSSDKGWTISFWFNFNNQLTGSGYSTTPYQNNQLKLLKINDNSGNNMGTIYYDYLTNTVRFYLTETSTTNNTDAYAVLPQFDKSYLVVVEYVPPANNTYEYGSINITIDGSKENNGSGKIYYSNTSLFSAGTIKLKIDGSSLFNTPTKPNNFIITSLLICDALSYQERSTDGSNQKFNYMYKSAFVNGEPKNVSRLNSQTSYFDFNSYNIKNTNVIKENISGQNFTSGKYKSILMESSVYGLRNLYINPEENFAKIFSDDDTASDYSNYTINSSSGIKLSTSSTQKLFWNIDNNVIADIKSPNINLLKYGEIPGTTISMQITKGSASSEIIFGIGDVYPNYNFNSTNQMYLKYYLDNTTSSWHYTLCLYNVFYDQETQLIDQIFSASSASSNIAVSISDSSLTLYTSDGGTNSIDINNGSMPISSNLLSLSIGNNNSLSFEKNYKNNFSGYIKNFGISLSYNSNFATYDFTELKHLMTRFTSTTQDRSTGQVLFPPSIKGTYIKVVDSILSNINCYIVGSQINWDTMDNCVVSISTDGGNSYSKINKFQPITIYDLYEMTKTFMIKVDVFDDPVVVDSNKEYFNNLSYYMFTSLGLSSDSANFTIEPYSSKLLSNYTIMDGETSSVYSRPANFGIKFTGDSVKPQGSALINNPNGSAYNVIEMWYRPDYLYTSVSNYILNNVSGSSASPAIWVDSSGKFKSLGGKLYINGASYTDGTFTASSNEMYHLALLLNSSASNNLYLNGENLGVSASRGIATYGHLQFWHYAPTQFELLSRFDSYFYLTSASVFDNSVLKSLSDRYFVSKLL